MRILTLLILLLCCSISISEPDTTCHQLDNRCIQHIRKELKIFAPIIVKEDDRINAYTNGFVIFITTGLLEVPGMTTESIKVVLLHEEGHIINRSHSIRGLYEKALRVELLMCESNQVCKEKAILRHLKEARDDEYRCDSYAIKKAHDMKLDPEKACYPFTIFARLHQYSLDDKKSTHPSAVDRYKKCIVGVSTGIIP